MDFEIFLRISYTLYCRLHKYRATFKVPPDDYISQYIPLCTTLVTINHLSIKYHITPTLHHIGDN